LVVILKIFLLETIKLSIKNKNFVEDLPMIIPGQFDSNLFCGFRKKDENVKFP
jgi:hypothetical protein